MNTYETVLILRAGSSSNPVYAHVEFSGRLTPDLAVAAARRAFGHARGVTVCDPSAGTSYRVSGDKARKQKPCTH